MQAVEIPDLQHDLEVFAETTEGVERLLNPVSDQHLRAVLFCLEHLKSKMSQNRTRLPSLMPVLYSGLGAGVVVMLIGIVGVFLPMTRVEYGGAAALLIALHFAAGRILLGVFPAWQPLLWYGAAAGLGAALAIILFVPAWRPETIALTVAGVGAFHIWLCRMVLIRKNYAERAKILFAATHIYDRFQLNAVVLSANQSADMIVKLLESDPSHDVDREAEQVANKLLKSFASHDPLGFKHGDLKADLGDLIQNN